MFYKSLEYTCDKSAKYSPQVTGAKGSDRHYKEHLMKPTAATGNSMTQGQKKIETPLHGHQNLQNQLLFWEVYEHLRSFTKRFVAISQN